MSLEEYREFHRRSLKDPNGFWAEQARSIDWNKGFEEVCDFSKPPFARWFVGGETNLCHNAVDRHLEARGDQNALVYVSTETDEAGSYTYRDLYREVNVFAAVLRGLGVGRGDRVVIYMPMMVEAVFAMLACVRLGAIHSIVFGGFAAANLAKRIDDAKPKVMVTADAGSRGGNVLRYKPLVDEAMGTSQHPPEHVVICRRGLDDEMELVEGRDLDYADLRERHRGVSHHTRSALRAALGGCRVAFPGRGDVPAEGLPDRHACERVGASAAGLEGRFGVTFESMGRRYDDDPVFFDAAVAAVALALGERPS